MDGLAIWIIDNFSNFYGVAFSLFVATQFKLLGWRAKKILLEECSNDDDRTVSIEEKLRQFLQEHQMLIFHVNEQNDIFGSVFLVCVLSCAISICFSLYVFVSVSVR